MELLELIKESGKGMNHALPIRLFPEDKFISGWMELSEYDKLDEGIPVEYDGYPVKIVSKTMLRAYAEIRLKIID